MNDPINNIDPDGQAYAPCVAAAYAVLVNQHRKGVQGAVAAGVAGAVGAATDGSSIGRIGVVGGKSAITGCASGFSGKYAATAVVGARGFIDGALRSDSDSFGVAVRDGAKTAAFESGTVFGAAVAAEALPGGKKSSDISSYKGRCDSGRTGV